MSKTPKPHIAKALNRTTKTSKKDHYPLSTCIKDYWILIDGYRGKFLFFTIVRALSELVPFGILFSLGKIVDFFTNYNKGDPLSQFYFFVALIGILGSLQILFRFHSKLGMKKIGAELRKYIRVAAMEKLIDLELKWHENEESGSKIERINNGAEKIYKGLSLFVDVGLYTITGIIGSLIIFLTLDSTYLLFATIYLTIYLIGENHFTKKIAYWQNELNKTKEKVSGKFYESASNLLTVKSLGLKKKLRNSTAAYENKLYNTWLETIKANQSKAKTIKVFGALGYATFILIIGFDAIAGIITVGSIFAFAGYFERLRAALDNLSNHINEFIRIKIGVGRFMNFMGVETFDRESNHLDKISSKWKKIEFKNISFKYKNENVIRDFNLTVNRGDKIGIVSASGGGKSTIVKLLLGLYQPQKGEITVDNKDINKYKHSSVIKNFSIVLQDSEMFNNTLLNNITISETKRDLTKIKGTIEISQLQPVIDKLPRGLNTLIGEKGYKLSGGERQRLGIARAAFKGGSLLILDEATSQLDSKTEKSIQENLNKYMKDKTLLVIAHRLSTLKNVDKIIFIEEGKIIEQGSFKDLLRLKGEFYKLYRLQHRK
ncbi:ABC transporter ATP-binding protein [Nanoarchaeota archaeon]